jgi:tripartite-type tricarboxylate transporter receptor subunit TctC
MVGRWSARPQNERQWSAWLVFQLFREVNAMKLPRRRFLHLAAGAAALPAAARAAMAESCPSRPVRIVVALPAGSSPDIGARLMAQWLSERLGQQFIVDNRPGANGNIGTEAVVRAAADGYTLLLAIAANAVNATLYGNLSFNFVRDLAPVAGIARIPQVMEVHPSVPATTIPEFIAYAKSSPGKLNMASGGVGGTPHVAGELFKMMAGVDMLHVPYRGNPRPDLLGASASDVRYRARVDRVHQERQAASARGDDRNASRCIAERSDRG